VGGKPADTVVDGQAAQVVMDSSGADFASASASAAVGFLSAPPGDPVADALTGGTAGGADAIEEPGDMNGTAILPGSAGFDPVPVSSNGSSGNGSGILRTDGEPADQVARPTDVTEAIAARPLLAEAVHAFVKHGYSVTAGARVLHLHPNTVKYRLDRWRELTGWDPWAPDGLTKSLLSLRLFGSSAEPRHPKSHGD